MFSFSNVKAIIFDLDDTLVKTSLDFTRLKADVGCTESDDILSFIANIDCPLEKVRANQIVLDHELEDAQTSVWLPGALSFIQQAKTHGLPLAIVTRNCHQATQMKIANNKIPINMVLTRDDAPAKPDPAGLLSIAKKWNIAPANIAYIGDYIYDIQAAHNANMQAWLYEQNISECDYNKCLRFVPAQSDTA